MSNLLDQFAEKQTPFDEHPEIVSLLEIMVTTLKRDGVIDRDEVTEFLSIVYEREPFRSLTDELGEDRLLLMTHYAGDKTAKQTIDETLRKAKEALSPELRAFAFELAFELSAADDYVAPEEVDILKQMQVVFELADDFVNGTVERVQRRLAKEDADCS